MNEPSGYPVIFSKACEEKSICPSLESIENQSDERLQSSSKSFISGWVGAGCFCIRWKIKTRGFSQIYKKSGCGTRFMDNNEK